MLTKRERDLMYRAFFMGFDCGMNDDNNGYSKRDLREVFKEILEEEVVPGMTIGDYWDTKGKEE